MVDILCPHCEEEISLDDDASGEFECPFCEGEFEWGMEEKKRPSSGTVQVNNLSTISHIVHGVCAVLLIIGLFSNWVVALDGVFGLTPFGIKISFMGFSETATYFELLEENFVIASAGLLFMLLVIGAILMQISHLVFRFIFHKMENGGDINIRQRLAYNAYKYRWHTSLGAFVFTAVGYAIVQIGAIMYASSIELTEVSVPKPSVFAIFTLLALCGQFVLMNMERHAE